MQGFLNYLHIIHFNMQPYIQVFEWYFLHQLQLLHHI